MRRVSRKTAARNAEARPDRITEEDVAEMTVRVCFKE